MGFWNRELRIELAGLSHELITFDAELITLDVTFSPDEVVVAAVVVAEVVVVVVVVVVVEG